MNLYRLNLKLEERERSDGGEVWNWRSDSDRLEAFRRKARFESISSLRISTAYSSHNQEIRRQQRPEVQTFPAVATEPLL